MLKRVGICSQCPTGITARSKSGLCGVCNRKVSKNQAAPFRWLYNRLQREATKRGLIVDLLFEDFLALTEVECCRYCNGPIVWHQYSRKGEAGINLDRKDNTKGYTKDNVCVCCFGCNTRKSNWLTDDEFQFVNDALRAYRNAEQSKQELSYTILTWSDCDLFNRVAEEPSNTTASATVEGGAKG